MKVVRLPSGPLACVYSLDESEREGPRDASGTFRAHSGSLHADGITEDEALAVLDEHVRRVSVPPPEDVTPSAAEPTVRVSEESGWAMRIRKCGPEGVSEQAASEAETPFDGVTVPPARAKDR
jgi:hypothetical protein